MMDKSNQKSSDKPHIVKRRKRCLYSTPDGAFDSLNFWLFRIKNLENQDVYPRYFWSKIIKFYTTGFLENHRFFKKFLGFSRNRPFLKK